MQCSRLQRKTFYFESDANDEFLDGVIILFLMVLFLANKK